MNAINKKSVGFTLIETLVALVVLGVGLLGIASLYVTSLKSGSGAINRLQAINLATDLADRIRANSSGGAAYASAGADNGCIGSKVCDSSHMAAYDVFLWSKTVGSTLPGGQTPVVTYTKGPPDIYSITVNWAEHGSAEILSYTLTVQL